MKTLPTKEIYQCEHCNKKHWVKGVMTRHESICRYNPATNDACLGCQHMEERVKEINSEYYQATINAKTFFCHKLQKEMYPFAAVRKGTVKRYPASFIGAERMPTSCNHFEREVLPDINY